MQTPSNICVLVAAYGRHYATADQAEVDWIQGLDFRIVDGPYCSIRDISELMNMYTAVYVDTDEHMVRVA